MASPHHLLNTSWTTHRLSPLHYGSQHGSLPEQPTLETYAHRLRDHLTNSFADAQGWRPAEEDTAGVSNTGALNTCTWEPISTFSFLNPQRHGDEDEDTEAEPAGILITLGYENITYKAALLADPSSLSSLSTKQKGKQPQRGRPKRTSSTSASTSTALPLLLTRLPKALREQFIAFLSSNFDTYISSLRFSSDVLCDLLQSYVMGLTPPSAQGGHATENTVLTEDIIREMHLTLSFAPPIAPSLKALNVSVPRETFASFLRTGSSGTGGDDGDSERVLSGLSSYLQKHLAFELGLGSGGVTLSSGYVRLTRIACAGFVVTGDGRVKVVGKTVEGDDGEEGARNQGMLRGGEALVRAVLRRACAEIEKSGS
ncbi:kinetochore complex Sim4 subunit Fta1-domain-containing protein [Aspergillus pseudoustus]|uniref:Kinetochore complex Sim4 subunit Fta1-domain-containing protein n=1 Tax=Aspergillus pseudoustus TaxID=1810923 RepID=A0ABR4KSL9_9EURO